VIRFRVLRYDAATVGTIEVDPRYLLSITSEPSEQQEQSGRSSQNTCIVI